MADGIKGAVGGCRDFVAQSIARLNGIGICGASEEFRGKAIVPQGAALAWFQLDAIDHLLRL